ncbi:hypothetical protein KUV50_15910 [Membranicola marinus]|uniref:Antitoxin ParD n=1 Tax=Membranihabitans marinus TaxID=1227546 RepID=A0A953LE70_9BACT|nr:hypothetical protein [Membranihabitans marinus]MBY5959639.1 hypothetical protein [Membranihabitans marinus]
MSRLTIEISKEEHRRIKTLAAMQGQTIKDFVMSRVFENEPVEDEDWQAFKKLLLDRIHDAENNESSHKSIKEIVREEVLLKE